MGLHLLWDQEDLQGTLEMGCLVLKLIQMNKTMEEMTQAEQEHWWGQDALTFGVKQIKEAPD